MLEPREVQVETCLLKYSLEKLENDLCNQQSALPFLDEEKELKCRETGAALNVARSLYSEIERLKFENGRLTARRMQLKQKSDNIKKSLQTAIDKQKELTKLYKQEDQEIEIQVRQYEDSLLEIAERYRNTHRFYNEDEVNIEVTQVTTVINELEDELQKHQNLVEDLRRQLDIIQPQVSENILVNMGKGDLDMKIKELTENYEALLQTRDLIRNKKKDVTSFMRFKNYFKNIIK